MMKHLDHNTSSSSFIYLNDTRMHTQLGSVCVCVVPWFGCWGCRVQMKPWWPRDKHQLCTGTGRSTLCTPPPPGAAAWAARSTRRRWWSPGCDSSRNQAETAPPWTETQVKGGESDQLRHICREKHTAHLRMSEHKMQTSSAHQGSCCILRFSFLYFKNRFLFKISINKN